MASRSLNKVMLIGNLTRDPNLRFTPSNVAVASFGLATNRSFGVGDQKKEEVEFHNLVAWSKLAEICAKFLHKGSKIYVEGRLQTRQWKTQDDQDRRITEIVIENMIMLSEIKKDGTQPAQEAEPPVDAPQGEDVSEDIPF